MALSDEKIQELAREATGRAASGDFAGAEPLFAEIAEARPNAGPALHLLGQVRLKLGRFAEAREPLERAATFLPRDPTVHTNVAGCLTQLGDFSRALQAIEHADRLKPNDPVIVYNKGRALQALGRTGEAEDSYGEALSRDHRLLPALSARAELLAERGDWMGALNDLDTALTSLPNDARLRMRRASLLLQQGDWLRGLGEHEARLEIRDARHWRSPLPHWDGQPLGTGHLLLYPEQADIGGPEALRDTLMLMRAINELEARDISAVVQCAAGFDLLVGATASGAFDRSRTAWRGSEQGFAAGAALRSLPHLLGWALDSVPPPTLIPTFAYELSAIEAKRVEDPRPPRRGLRRVPRAHIDFEPGQANPPNPRLRIGWLCDEHSHLHDIETTFAAYLERFDAETALGSADGSGLRLMARNLYRCDLVVGEDTWPTHLAALMGVPVLMLLPRPSTNTGADWLWGLRAGATRWYPTMELLREDDAGWRTATLRLKALLDQAHAVGNWRDAPAMRWEPGQP